MTTEQHLDEIKENVKDILIHEHIEKMFGSLDMASVEYFIQTGKINGGFRQKLFELIEAANRYKMNLK